MPIATALLLFLSQAGNGAPPRTDFSIVECRLCAEESLPAAEPHAQEAQYEEQELRRRFNGLVTALIDFSNTYNSRGVIDVKKVKAVQKALRELEKSTWFKQTSDREVR
jgi:hypothetical protein